MAEKQKVVYVPTPRQLLTLPGRSLFTILAYIAVFAILAIIIIGGYAVERGFVQSGPFARAWNTVKFKAIDVIDDIKYALDPTFITQRIEQKWSGKDVEDVPSGILIQRFDTASRRNTFSDDESITAQFVLEASGLEDFQGRMPIRLTCSINNGEDTESLPTQEESIFVGGTKKLWTFTCEYPNELIQEMLVSEDQDTQLSLLGEIEFDSKSNTILKVYYIREELNDFLITKDVDFWEYYPAYAAEEPEAPTLPYRYYGEPVELKLKATEDTVQPVVVHTKPSLQPLVFIGLSSRWKGEVTEFDKVSLELPPGVRIRFEGEGAITGACPFEYSGTGKAGGELYIVDSNYLDKIQSLKSGEGEVVFICRLDVPESALDQGEDATQRFYLASAEYSYRPKQVMKAVTIKPGVFGDAVEEA